MEENEAPEGSPNAVPAPVSAPSASRAQGAISEGSPNAVSTQGSAPSERRIRGAISPQAGAASCPTCGAAAGPNGADTSYIYALGRIEARFPTAGVGKEFAQATARAKTSSQSDREVFHAVLS